MLIAIWSDVQHSIIDTAIDQWRKHLHSLGMCLCKWWTLGTSFVNKLLQTISIFTCFWFKWLLPMVSDFYCVDA